MLRAEPAVVPAGDDVVEPRRLVPRQADAPLVVRVVGERLAVRVEVEVVGVAEPVRDDLDLLAVRADAQQHAGDRVFHRRARAGDELPRHPGHVPAQQVQPAVRAAADGVGVVLAAGPYVQDRLGLGRPACVPSTPR